MASIPESHRDIILGKNFGHLCTLMPDGSPQSTPVWVDLEGDLVVINTADGRQKAKNLNREPRVAISVADAANPYRYIQVRGRVVEKTFDGADAHIDKLAKKYMDADSYPYRTETERRVVYKIAAEKVSVYG